MADEGVLIIYGRGADLGNFKFFADDLVTTDLAAYDKSKIVIKNIERRNGFFDILYSPPFAFKLKEFHIFSHSIGAGLFLGYKDTGLASLRQTAIMNFLGRRTPYLTVLSTEEGAVLTDDLVREPYTTYRATIQSRFAPDAKIKIWGCNSGIANWYYSDPVDAEGHTWTSDPNATAQYYYWRALNELNVPKPSIAQAFANYFRVTTFGAKSGSSIKVKHQGQLISSDRYKKVVGRWPSEAQVLRLVPDSGDFYEHKPE